MVFVIWVTEACNLKCKYCYEGIEKNRKFMTADTASHLVDWIIEQMTEHGAKYAQIRFHGGEPLLNFDIIRIIVIGLKKRTEYEYSFQLTTNAWCMNEEQMAFLAENIDELSVSLDGVSEVHNANRLTTDGSPTFDTVLSHAYELKKIAPQTSVRMTITPELSSKFEESVIFLIEQGFNDIISSIDIFDQSWDEELIDDLEDQCKRISDYISENYDDDEISIGYPVYSDIKCRKCSGGIDGFNIDTTGRLYPCTYTVGKPQFQCGDIFNGVDLNKVAEFKSIYEREVEVCDGCGAYSVCTSVRCKFLNYVISGDLFAPLPVLCSITRKSVQSYLNEHK